MRALRFMVLGALIGGLAACSSNGAPAPSPTPAPKEFVVGGFQTADSATPEVQKAVDQTLKTLRTLPAYATATIKQVVAVERQVVAGLNYRLTLVLTINNQDQTLIVHMYENLDRQWQLTSVETPPPGK